MPDGATALPGPPDAGRAEALLRGQPALARLVALARERVQAREVWLIGSRARGDATPHSDWDILVVLDDEAAEDAAEPMRLWRLGRDAGLVADIVAERQSDLRAAGDVTTTLAYVAKREGVRLG